MDDLVNPSSCYRICKSQSTVHDPFQFRAGIDEIHGYVGCVHVTPSASAGDKRSLNATGLTTPVKVLRARLKKGVVRSEITVVSRTMHHSTVQAILMSPLLQSMYR